jgi:hypothetical protein
LRPICSNNLSIVAIENYGAINDTTCQINFDNQF